MDKTKYILNLLDKIPAGQLFDNSIIKDNTITSGDLAVCLHNLKEKGVLRSISKGIYYKPLISKFGFGELPVNEDEVVRYYMNRYDAHISGPYAYNAIGLTEQIAMTVTLSGPKPFQNKAFNYFRINYTKSNVGKIPDKDVRIIILLDAIKDIKHIPANSDKDVYKKIKKTISTLSSEQRKRINEYAYKYPTQVRYILSKMTDDASMLKSVKNISKYDTAFKNTISA